jgi:phosphatidate cytidylyltransferase
VLLKRVLTALVLLPPAVAAVLFLDVPGLSIVFGAIGALAAWEWAALCGIQGRGLRVLYAAAVAAVLAMWLPMLGFSGAVNNAGCDAACGTGALRVLLIADAVWWLLALTWIVRYPNGFSPRRPSLLWRAALGLLVIPAAVVGLLSVRASALARGGLLTLFALVWAADIAAYFVGRALGRRKLAPQVSPGKSWEGFCGGMIGALLVGIAAGTWLQPSPGPWALWLPLCVFVAAVSVVGDLTESLLKRLVGVKDSGTLLPGHGGVLDRIDSLLAAAPMMALGLSLLKL